MDTLEHKIAVDVLERKNAEIARLRGWLERIADLRAALDRIGGESALSACGRAAREALAGAPVPEE